MKAKPYLETTIVSYLVARPSRDAVLFADQKMTRAWWNKRLSDFEVYISDVVLEEAAAGDVALAKKRLKTLSEFSVLPTTPQSQKFARELTGSRILPAKAAADAAHLAIAAVHDVHFLLTWNCRHLANAEILRRVEHYFKAQGCDHPTVCTPRELMGAFEV